MKPAIQFIILWFVVSTNVSAQEISFNRLVRPILADRCFHCHGPDAKNQESEFRLDTEAHALEDLGGYFGVVAGDLEASELHYRIRSDVDDDRMPPPDAVRQLTDDEKDILDAWILQGAKYEPHWSFIPVRETINVPEVGEHSKAWAVNDIDRFVLAKIAEQELANNNAASRGKWMRRVTFDLTGLPPTIEHLEKFLADESEQAFEVVVDRLLNSTAYAERMTSEWLDVARYSDSYGYQRDDARNVWPYRDWVIDAFKSNMPYDQFITEQLAGDLLPNATQQQKLATAFNRLHSHKKEGGSSPEEFRVEYVADRTNTVSAAFMGLTMECARCHDHKYDPIKTKEYYQLGAFFSNIDEYGIISFFTDATPTPAMPLPTAEQATALRETLSEIEDAEAELEMSIESSKEEFNSWLDEYNPDLDFGMVAHLDFDEFFQPADKGDAPGTRLIKNLVAQTPPIDSPPSDLKPAKTNDRNKLVGGKFDKAIVLSGDDSVNLPDVGHFSREQPFSFSLWINTPEVEERSVIYRRSRGWDDAGHIGYELTRIDGKLAARLSHFWPGNAIGIETDEFLNSNQWYHIAVTYDGSSKANGLRLFVDGKLAPTQIVQDQLTRQITIWNGGYNDLAIGTRYRDRGFKGGKVDEFKVFNRQIASIEVANLFDSSTIQSLIDAPREQLSQEARQQLLEQYVLATPSFKPVQNRLKTARKKWNALMDSTDSIAIMRESKSNVRNFVLTRGSFTEHGEQVNAATPEFLTKFPQDTKPNRLGLAKWLTAPNHPLTARVTVNRYWQLMFGNGLVRTPEDFGLQGASPTHPDLLDWLARDLMNNGWDIQRLLKQIALSSTYRQSSVVTSDVRAKDPPNFWLARGTNQRLSAEMVRDNALAISGLLVDKMGGPPVKPYDLAVSFKPADIKSGSGVYRRSLYTFWQRSAPAPVMMTMNASKRDVCRVRREVTSSPLQAFVLMNSPQFVEASRVLAARLLKSHGEETCEIIGEAFLSLTSRKPTVKESQILKSLFDEQLEAFDAEPDEAAALLKTGFAEVDETLSATRLAAITVVVNAIMNLDESVRHQ